MSYYKGNHLIYYNVKMGFMAPKRHIYKLPRTLMYFHGRHWCAADMRASTPLDDFTAKVVLLALHRQLIAREDDP